MHWQLLLALLVLWQPQAGATPHNIATGPVQLATRYDHDVNPAHYLISEKLDGIRARWTGRHLLTRNGNPIHAPAWFTDSWPDVAMDGELWTKRGDFERIASIVLSDTPDKRWQQVSMMLFDLPNSKAPFVRRVAAIKAIVEHANNPHLQMIPQFTLNSPQALEARLDAITAAGGEGLMLHHRQALYKDGRSNSLLKAKRFEDAEAKVIAYLPGKGKFSDMMGSLLVQTPDGREFKLGSGFSLRQRQRPPAIGSWITFKYYGLTQKGIPRFASFLHVRPAKDTP
ncbi:DNA ligase [Alteromonas gilva]|uniref:DNA ligase n=1 Tax=Alteromonas gilva TaxID=2987522 RepID=A0ABT5KXN5_9ALTE|nr:DNA ligase [Alteromonas gilva]MDC8829516.1 DNA ligase [Alteromonas gilva]